MFLSFFKICSLQLENSVDVDIIQFKQQHTSISRNELMIQLWQQAIGIMVFSPSDKMIRIFWIHANPQIFEISLHWISDNCSSCSKINVVNIRNDSTGITASWMSSWVLYPFFDHLSIAPNKLGQDGVTEIDVFGIPGPQIHRSSHVSNGNETLTWGDKEQI